MSATKVKEYISNYNSIASRFIQDENLSLEIQQNISFVENYIDKIYDTFEFEEERQIAYRELGVIIHSCFEAVLKSVLFEINELCKKYDCKEKDCSYRRCRSLWEINSIRVMPALKHLINTRLFMFLPEEMEEINKFTKMRNYVHLSAKIGNKKELEKFNTENLYKMLDYYYELLNQLDLCDFYFGKEKECLKIIDQDGFEGTTKELLLREQHYRMSKFAAAIRNLLWRGEISSEERLDLLKYNEKDSFNKEEAFKYVVMTSYPALGRCNSEEDYTKAKERILKLLSKYMSKKFVNDINKEI